MLRYLFACALALFCVPAISYAQDTPLARLIVVAPEDSGLSRTFFGQVTARETVDLAFQVGGQVVRLPAVEGETLDRGALIAELDLEPFQLQVEEAEARADQASRTLLRLERLVGSAISEVQVEDARTDLRLAEIALRNAERALEQATLTAPFDALVAARHVANFSSIAAGTPIARLHDMSELRIDIDVPEILFQQAGADPEIEILARFPTSDRLYPAIPREFNAEASDVGQTFRISLGLTPPDDLVVLPGSSVRVDARLLSDLPPVVIPVSALSNGNDGTPHVMVFEPVGAAEGTVTRTEVSIAPTPDGKIAILSGLEPGQEIVASGAALLADGATVRRFTGF